MKDDIHKLPKIGDPQHDGCFQMYLADWEPADIARDTGVNFNTLRSWIMKGGWAAKKKALDELRAKRHPPESHPIVKAAMKKDKGAMREEYLENAGVAAVENMQHIAKNMTPAERLEMAQNIAAIGKHDRDQLEITKDQEVGFVGHINLGWLNNPQFVVLENEKAIASEKVVEIQETK
jgi:hypothetical protein